MVAGTNSDLYSAMGLNPTLDDLDSTDLGTLTRSIERYFLNRSLNRSNQQTR